MPCYACPAADVRHCALAPTTTSPGYIGGWPLLAGFMDGGGRLLISGRTSLLDDRDATAPTTVLPARRYLYDSAGMDIVNGVRGDVFTGISMTLTPVTRQQQRRRDVISPFDDEASAVITYTTVITAVAGGLKIATATIRPSIWLRLEGAGPASARQQTLQQLCPGSAYLSCARRPMPARRLLARQCSSRCNWQQCRQDVAALF